MYSIFILNQIRFKIAQGLIGSNKYNDNKIDRWQMVNNWLALKCCLKRAKYGSDNPTAGQTINAKHQVELEF